MVQIELDAKDFGEIAEFLANLGGAVHLLVQSKGTLAMAAVVGREARKTKNFTDRSGSLRKSIGWRSKSVTITVPVVLGSGQVVNRRRRIKGNAVVFTWGKGSGGSRAGKGARHGYVVERGHRIVRGGNVVGFASGRFYLRDAFTASIPNMTSVFLAKARSEVSALRSELAGERDIRQITRKLLVARRTRLGF